MSRMPGAGRPGDKAQVQGLGDAHGVSRLPAPCRRAGILGLPTVNINKKPALRIDDMGIHAARCGPNMWTGPRRAPRWSTSTARLLYRMSD